MIEYMRLIIGEVGTREREREGLKIGRSERSRTIWAAVKGPQCWGRKRRLQLPPTAEEEARLHSD